MVKVTPSMANRQFTQPGSNPCMPIPPVVTELTGISDEDVKSAPAFGSIAGKVLEFLEGADFGGVFNVERFDLPLLARNLLMPALNLIMPTARFMMLRRFIICTNAVIYLQLLLFIAIRSFKRCAFSDRRCPAATLSIP